MSYFLRPMTVSDWQAADLVARAAFERDTSFLPYIALHASIQPDGMWVADDGGQVVGTVTAINYGQVGYIGIMTVRPDYQSRGIGRALLNEALAMFERQSCPTALLDATLKGARLYETVDFVDDSSARVYELAPDTPPVRQKGSTRLAQVDDLEKIIAFDAQAFGGNREKLLTALWNDYRPCCLVLRDSDGDLAGYLFARDGLWGPWAAVIPEAAADLLTSALSLPRRNTPTVMVPRSNTHAQKLFSDSGFFERRRLRHMRRGGDGPPGAPLLLYGQSSFGHG